MGSPERTGALDPKNQVLIKTSKTEARQNTRNHGYYDNHILHGEPTTDRTTGNMDA